MDVFNCHLSTRFGMTEAPSPGDGSTQHGPSNRAMRSATSMVLRPEFMADWNGKIIKWMINNIRMNWSDMARFRDFHGFPKNQGTVQYPPFLLTYFFDLTGVSWPFLRLQRWGRTGGCKQVYQQCFLVILVMEFKHQYDHVSIVWISVIH